MMWIVCFLMWCHILFDHAALCSKTSLAEFFGKFHSCASAVCQYLSTVHISLGVWFGSAVCECFSTVHISLSVWFGSAVWECLSTVHISLSVWFGSAVCEYLSTAHIF